ncbi:MAG: hypothetical protein P4L84_27070 [Isosphaeraceae bacterium]|nr:hypothetical protein [Isosphaeraceae bacterium]
MFRPVQPLRAIAVSCVLSALATARAQDRDPGPARKPAHRPGRLPVLDAEPLRNQLVAPAPVAVGLHVTPGRDEFVAAMAPHWTRKFRPSLRLEYQFARRLFALNPAQRRDLALAGERALVTVAREYAATQLKRRGARGPGEYPYPQPRRAIQDALAQALSQWLSSEDSARYRDELGAREEYLKRTAARNMIAQLEADLKLSAGQCAQVDVALLSHWDDRWCDSPEPLQHLDQQFPQLPDDLVVPYLSEAQVFFWREEYRNRRFIHVEIMEDREPEDAEEDDDLAAARRAVAE